jgi:hypothetical protein
VGPRRNRVLLRRGRSTLGLAVSLLCGLALLFWLTLCCGLAGAASAAPLPPPTDLAASAEGSSAIYLTWDAPSGAPDGLTLAGYDVYQGTSPGEESGTPINPSALIAGTSDTVTDLASGTAFYFDVIAIYQGSEGGGIPSAASNEASATTSEGEAPAPAGLTAVAESSSGVNLSWNAPVGAVALPVLGYDVYQGTSPGGESATPVNSSPIAAVSYPVTDLDSGTTYYFEVTAVYRDGQSPPSPEASATTATTSSTAQPQVVTFPPLASHPVGASFTVAASASSGLPVSFGSQTPSVCTVTGTTVTTLAAGQCEIQASQAGNADFQPATAVIQGFTVAAVGRDTPTAPASGPTPGHTPTAAGSAGPGKLVAILLAVAVALLTGILILLAARLWGARRQSGPRPPTPPATRVKAEPQPGPPPAVRIRVTGTEPTHAVRIEPHPGTRSTQIEEVRS